jgi:hypothetical protein
MAGRPKRRSDLAKLGDLGAERITSMLAEGRTARSVAAELNVGEGTFRAFVRRPENLQAYEAAKRASAHALADQSLEIADSATPERAQVAKLQVDTRKWLASKLDPGTFSDQQGPLVNIDLGRIHLEALKNMNEQRELEKQRKG